MTHGNHQQFIYFLILAGLVMLPFVWGLLQDLFKEWDRDIRNEDGDGKDSHRFDDYQE